MVRAIEPTPPAEFKQDTSMPSRTGWETAVQHRFVTKANTELRSARIEPIDGDTAAAEPISIVTELPVNVPCGEPAEIRLLSKKPEARGILVVETDHPAVPEWRTRVEFAPLGKPSS